NKKLERDGDSKKSHLALEHDPDPKGRVSAKWEPVFGQDHAHALESSASSHQAHDQKQDDGADRGIDDLRDEPRADANAELGKQETRHQRAGDADQDVAD